MYEKRSRSSSDKSARRGSGNIVEQISNRVDLRGQILEGRGHSEETNENFQITMGVPMICSYSFTAIEVERWSVNFRI